jgi:hypothetical protein
MNKDGTFYAFYTIAKKILFGMTPEEKKEIESGILRIMDIFNTELVVLQCLIFYFIIFLFMRNQLNFGYPDTAWIVMLIVTPIALIYLIRELWKCSFGIASVIFQIINFAIATYYIWILIITLIFLSDDSGFSFGS